MLKETMVAGKEMLTATGFFLDGTLIHFAGRIAITGMQFNGNGLPMAGYKKNILIMYNTIVL